MISVKKKDDRPSIPKSVGMKSLPLHLDSFLEYGKFIHSVKETLERLLYSRYCTSDSLDS